MKKLLFLFVFVSVALSGCKKNDNSPVNEETKALFELSALTGDVRSKFLEVAPLVNGNPKIAFMQTLDWVNQQPGVASASQFDSTYMLIEMTSGMEGVFQFVEITSDGASKFRGNGVGTLKSISSSGPCSNVMENKNVLMYAPGYDEFHIETKSRVPDLLAGSSVVENVEVLKNDQATVDKIMEFSNYGLVLIETHGTPWSFMTGSQFNFEYEDIPTDYDEFKDDMIGQIGQANFDRLTAGKLMVGREVAYDPIDPEWWANQEGYFSYGSRVLHASARLIADIPSLSNTIVFGNFCCSGWAVPVAHITEPIGKAFIDMNPITYYAYQRDDGYARPVDNVESMELEDSVITRLIIDGDSTGVAHQKHDGSLFSTTFPDLFLKQIGHPDWCYADCNQPFTDPRDGQIYQTVCIGDQVWMAENLRHNGVDNWCYNNDPSWCNTENGRYYTWENAMLACPDGWHLPSLAEWQQLADELGGTQVAGGKMKSTGGYWNSPNGGATNSSGFNALGSGALIPPSDFSWRGYQEYFWTSTEDTPDRAVRTILQYVNANIDLDGTTLKSNGFMCRCVKDE